jgi:aminomethyltransferase
MSIEYGLSTQFTEGYQQAQTGAVWVELPERGVFHITDRDRLDLLHRLSTNHLNRLPAGQWTTTVFTTAIARIIDAVTVFNQGEKVLLITGEKRGGIVQNWLRRNVFFNDRFEIQEVSESLHLLGVFGQHSHTLLARLWPALASLQPAEFGLYDGVLVAQVNSIGGMGYWLVVPRENLAGLQDQLTTQGILPVSFDVYEALRIAAGVPSAQNELTEEYIPLEMGLWDAVSFNKGCYIGQEIIARMESRGQLAKQLVRLQLQVTSPVGARLLDETGKAIGTLTSITQIPDKTQVEILGLGVVKTTLANPQQLIFAETETGPVPGVVLGIAGHYEANYQ